MTEVDTDRFTLLLFNGGGQPPYTKFDKVVRLMSTFDVNLIAVELPGHGKSTFNDLVTTEEMLQQYYEEIGEVCSNYSQLAAFGYSLGGLLAMKALEHDVCHFKFVIIAGAAMTIDEQQEEVMKYYTSMEFFQKKGWDKLVLDYHQDGWRELLHSVHAMLYVDSNIFVRPHNIAKKSVSLHLVLGDQDEVADYQLQQPFAEQYRNIMLHLLPETGHFDYFVKSWKKMENTLKKIMENELEEKKD